MTAMDDVSVKAIAPGCLRCAFTTKVLVPVMAKPEFPMMLVETVSVDVSVMVAAPMAYLRPFTAKVDVSLMAAAPTA